MDFGDILDEWEKQRAVKPAPAAKPVAKPSPEAAGVLSGKPVQKEAATGATAKTGAKPAAKTPPRIDPLTEWLRLNPVYDKDADAEEIPIVQGERRRRLLRKKPDAELDLHGLLQAEAWTALEMFFQEGRRRSFEKLLVIHGKGNHSVGEGPLRRLTARFIENCPFAGESGHSSAIEGGSGATWVILRGEEKED